MRIGVSHIYKILRPFDNEKIFDRIISDMEKCRLEFRNIWFEIRDYEISGKKNKKLKELIKREDMQKYEIHTEYDNKGDREIKYNNYYNEIEKCRVENLLKDLLCGIKKSMFWDIILANIVWNHDKNICYNTLDECLDYIKVSNTYNGMLLELSFESGHVNNIELMLEKVEKIACLKIVDKKNIIILTNEESLQFVRLEQKVHKFFKKFDKIVNLDFELSKEETSCKIQFSSILKKIIFDTKYCYNGYKSGYYEIYKYDKYNSCIKILFTYDYNLKQLSATIRYCVPYSENSFGVFMPTIREKLCRENIINYIKFCVKVADEISLMYEKFISQDEEYKNIYIDMKNLTEIRII